MVGQGGISCGGARRGAGLVVVVGRVRREAKDHFKRERERECLLIEEKREDEGETLRGKEIRILFRRQRERVCCLQEEVGEGKILKGEKKPRTISRDRQRCGGGSNGGPACRHA